MNTYWTLKKAPSIKKVKERKVISETDFTALNIQTYEKLTESFFDEN